MIKVEPQKVGYCSFCMDCDFPNRVCGVVCSELHGVSRTSCTYRSSRHHANGSNRLLADGSRETEYSVARGEA